MKSSNRLSGTFLFVRACLLLLVLLSCQVSALVQEWIDRDGFPEAYRILTSDHLMYPDNVTDWPMKIDSKRQLFVDDEVISSMDNLVRQFHQPDKYAGNPLRYGWPVAVMHDAATGKFRMWYDTSYAESSNGINWSYICRTITDTPGNIRGFGYNPNVPEQEGRYKAVVFDKYDAENPKFYICASQDGKSWHRQVSEPVLEQRFNHMLSYAPESKAIADSRVFQWTNPDHFQSVGLGDTTLFQYDPVLNKYTCSNKYNLYIPSTEMSRLGIEATDKIRLRAFMESDDLVHWTSPRFIFFPDTDDTPGVQIYGFLNFPYESMWLGVMRKMLDQAGHRVDLHLVYSRDGRHWLRPRDRTSGFIPFGAADSWDADYLAHAMYPPILIGDELWFYYMGMTFQNNYARIGLAKLRRDGFASLDAGDEVGTLTTRPVTFAGTKLYVNADVGENGWLKAAVLTQDRDAVQAYGLDDSVAVTTDTTQSRMVWHTRQELVPPGTEHVRLLFQYKNARLYSFWIE